MCVAVILVKTASKSVVEDQNVTSCGCGFPGHIKGESGEGAHKCVH